MGWEESEFNCWRVREPLILFLFYMNVFGIRPQCCLSSQHLTIPAPWVLFCDRWSITLVPPWVTASHFLAGNREAELKPTPFFSLLLFCFHAFPLLLTPQRHSTFERCLLGLLLNNIYIIQKH